MFWHKVLTVIWIPLQFITLFGVIWYCANSNLGRLEKFGLFFSVRVITGTIGIVYSTELVNQSNRKELAVADILLSMNLYSHFRSKYQVNHKFIGTPRDSVTAHYHEIFINFLYASSKNTGFLSFTQKTKLERENLQWYNSQNPFSSTEPSNLA